MLKRISFVILFCSSVLLSACGAAPTSNPIAPTVVINPADLTPVAVADLAVKKTVSDVDVVITPAGTPGVDVNATAAPGIAPERNNGTPTAVVGVQTPGIISTSPNAAANSSAAPTITRVTQAPTKTPPATTARPPVPELPDFRPVPTPAIKPSVMLSPMKWESQTFNNCGPATLMMAMSYYGVNLTQEQCRNALRPNPEDRQTFIEDMLAFVRKQGLKAALRENGDTNRIRTFLSAGVPVITQQWLHENDDIAHWRVARGYNLGEDTIIFNDSMDTKPNTNVKSADMDKLWKAFDRRYIIIYTEKNETLVRSILGDDLIYDKNLQRSLTSAQTYANQNPKDIDAWRNLGYLLSEAGDCKGAIKVWENNLTKMLKPTETGIYNRFMWYQMWPIECYNAVNNYPKVEELANLTFKSAPVYAQVRYQYAVALLGMKRSNEAVAQLKRALLDDPTFAAPLDLLAKLGIKP